MPKPAIISQPAAPDIAPHILDLEDPLENLCAGVLIMEMALAGQSRVAINPEEVERAFDYFATYLSNQARHLHEEWEKYTAATAATRKGTEVRP